MRNDYNNLLAEQDVTIWNNRWQQQTKIFIENVRK